MRRLRMLVLFALCGACNALLGNEEGFLAQPGGPAGGSAGSTSSGGTNGGSAGSNSTGGSNGGSPSAGGSISSGGTTGGSISTGGVATGGMTGGSFSAGGTSGSSGAGGSGGMVCTANGIATTDPGGYMTSGAWHGHAFLFAGGAGTMISPANFLSLAANSAPCICGSVAPTFDQMGVAAVGFNINQPMGGVEASTTPDGTGLSYALGGTVPSGARIQVQGLTGVTDETIRWCAPVEGATGQIPWSSFKFQCWEGGAQTPMPAGSPISMAFVMVPGNDTSQIPFDFCLLSMHPY